MESMTHEAPAVNLIRLVGLPETLPGEPAPFEPAPEDEAWLLGFATARDGESARLPGFGWGPEARLRFARGVEAGRAARSASEARMLGLYQGEHSAVSEPPGGFSDAERAAWGEGFEEGRARAEAFDEWLSAEEERRAIEEMHAGEGWDHAERVEAMGHRAYP